MTTLLDLTAHRYESRVLAGFLASRPGAAQRAGVQPQAAGIVPTGNYRFGGIDWDDWVRGNMTSQPGVSEATARAVAAVTACVNLIGGSVAAMPLHTYKVRGDDREGYKDALWYLLNERPYMGWSAAAMWEHLVASRLFHGDAFMRIIRGGRAGADAVGFEPLHPSRVVVDKIDGMLIYNISSLEAGVPSVNVQAPDMIHVAGPGFDGRRSISQLQYGLRYPAGIASSADVQAATFMNDGARPDFAIEMPGTLSAQQQEDLRNSWLKRHEGPGAKRAPVILAGGMKLHQLTMSMEDAQLLSTRAFQIEEICRIFGVPPFMIGHTEKTTSWGSGIEQMSIGFVKYTLQRHLVAIEQELNFKLFKTATRFCEFVTAGLERGDIKGRFEAYRIAMGRAGEPGWMKASEIRKLENMPRDDSFDNPPPADPVPTP
jgi:HK97 family phage portal protein